MSNQKIVDKKSNRTHQRFWLNSIWTKFLYNVHISWKKRFKMRKIYQFASKIFLKKCTPMTQKKGKSRLLNLCWSMMVLSMLLSNRWMWQRQKKVVSSSMTSASKFYFKSVNVNSTTNKNKRISLSHQVYLSTLGKCSSNAYTDQKVSYSAPQSRGCKEYRLYK